ncbi:hypothetical protein DFH06DRAFT_613621 [Mycena polygramma]|nr:hypothetical protein DFH06DRAFT_613621 [Mycena polygramma]
MLQLLAHGALLSSLIRPRRSQLPQPHNLPRLPQTRVGLNTSHTRRTCEAYILKEMETIKRILVFKFANACISFG